MRIAQRKYAGTFRKSTGRKPKKLEALGEAKTVREWVQDERSGTKSLASLYHRIERGWPEETAVAEKPLGKGQYLGKVQ